MRATAAAKQPPFTPPEGGASATALGPLPMSREARLAAWAELLERSGELAQVRRLDDAGRAERGALRRDGSAASVAFADPLLRAAGLGGDSVEAACAFFRIGPDECHRVLCECGAVRTLTGPRAAATVRRLVQRPRGERIHLRLCAALASALLVLLGIRLLLLA